jgi:hypothetical protein
VVAWSRKSTAELDQAFKTERRELRVYFSKAGV